MLIGHHRPAAACGLDRSSSHFLALEAVEAGGDALVLAANDGEGCAVVVLVDGLHGHGAAGVRLDQ
ncbi:hypothetical protein D3C72_1852070 [compost metagenome]